MKRAIQKGFHDIRYSKLSKKGELYNIKKDGTCKQPTQLRGGSRRRVKLFHGTEEGQSFESILKKPLPSLAAQDITGS